MTHPSVERGVEAATDDVTRMIETVSMALAIDGDLELRQALRHSAECPPDHALILQLPMASVALEIGRNAGLSLVRSWESARTPRLETLTAANCRLRSRVTAACAKAKPVAQELFKGFILPGSLPSRSSFETVFSWAPLIEISAYRFAARASSMLDDWRHAALKETSVDTIRSQSVISLYYSLAHTMAHLTLLSSELGATGWLADMAHAFEWINWTPSAPLLRERTVWLAAAAAKSAAAFGPNVVDLYLRTLTRSRHAYKVFDALYGLASIAMAHDGVLTPIMEAIAAAQDTSINRMTTGAEQAPWLFRSTLAMLRQWADDRSVDAVALRQLGWNSDPGVGLATRQAFRLDPTSIDVRGRVLGIWSLPAIMQTAPAGHYPLRSPLRSPLLPQLRELSNILERAWVGSPRTVRTIH